MRHLHLLRHAKSSWKESDLEDHDRPLSKRGQRDAAAMAARLAALPLAPDLVLCSSALRTRLTLDPVMHAMRPGAVVLERGLYEAGRAALLRRLREVDDGFGCVLLIGHNPGLQDLALHLAGPAADERAARLRAKFPTAALASFRVAASWRELGPKTAELVGFVTPSENESVGL
jgi:phosphohistidine phosphatase